MPAGGKNIQSFWTPGEIELGAGVLDVQAFVDATTEVPASVEVVGVETRVTPFQLTLEPGTYTLKGTYQGQTQIKVATIYPDQTTYVKFLFTSDGTQPKPPLLPNVREKLYPIIPGVFDRVDQLRQQR